MSEETVRAIVENGFLTTTTINTAYKC